jgi:tRNA (guanine37-N1)-methyltransferase
MKIDIVSIFPEYFVPLDLSLIGRARAAGLLRVDVHDLRQWTHDVHRTVDDTPYGGGPGMVMRPEPLAAAIEHVEQARGPARRLLLSPQGRLFDQQMAAALAREPRVMLICGRYEGIDERLAAACAHDVVSIGDYVLSGGELAAAVIVEAVARLCPGVIGKNESTVDESFSAGRLEYPHYTRPPEWRGQAVPEVLLSGDHAAIAAWRRRQALHRTRLRRPDLLAKHPPSAEEQAWLQTDTEPDPDGGRDL